MNTKVFVYSEHTLCYRNDCDPPHFYGVLNGLGTRGGKSIHDGPFCAYGNDIRPATREDFNTFRVQYHPDYEVAV